MVDALSKKFEHRDIQ